MQTYPLDQSSPKYHKSLPLLVVLALIAVVILVYLFITQPRTAPVVEQPVHVMTAKERALAAPNPQVPLTADQASAKATVLAQPDPQTQLTPEQAAAKQRALEGTQP